MFVTQKYYLGLLCAIFFAGATTVSALPFNDDMVHDQLSVGEVMRSAPKGSIPLGANEHYVKDKAAAAELKNPISGDEQSTKNGKRLWDVNCSACHGLWTGAGFERAIPLETGLMLGPDLTADFYKGKSDGELYAAIQFGGLAVMPRYGWKLSPKEHWDIVNYVRHLQNGK